MYPVRKKKIDGFEFLCVIVEICVLTCDPLQDYKLKLHLMLNHKNEPAGEMAKAKEVLTKSKLDGCIHKCGLCGSRYNSVANFTRHIKDVHQITRAEYR